MVTSPLHVTAKDSVAGDRWLESSHPDQHLSRVTFPGSLFFFEFRSRLTLY
jgi:hypothetical protein